MEVVRKALIVGALLGAGAGVGSALFALVTPGERKTQDMFKMPEMDSQRRAEAARTKELLLATLREAAATQENVAWRKNWMESGDHGRRSA
ncbi:ubiquinol-cytochrome-c reductase complex assembly factor 3 [Rhynchocyon petersi]